MTRTQAVEAIAAGIALVRAQKAQGCQLLATGEMGIGNTTTLQRCGGSACSASPLRS